MKPILSGLLPLEITQKLNISPDFRGDQIFKWIHCGVESFSQMANLPKDLRENLSDKSVIFSSSVSQVLKDSDGTVKLKIKLKDNLNIETVLLQDNKGRKTACLSTQAGCAMGCLFCKTGKMGLLRNLTASEIVEQFLLLKNMYGNISNIVFMGMGEPFANPLNLFKAIEILHFKSGTALGYKRFTISTCGLVKEIINLADKGPDVLLAVSLISADSKIRENLMPVTKSNSLEQLQKAIVYYQKKRKHRVTFEYILIKGINDRAEDIIFLNRFIKPIRCLVNLIPWNPVESILFSESDTEKVHSFKKGLENLNINVSCRFRRGRGINGACGQLAT